jgi:Holliday junction resolvase RusA-like endonuclease
MSEPITVIIPGDPHGKQRPRFRANGSTYTPTPTKNYEKAVATLASVEMRGRPILTEPVQVEMKAVFPIPNSWSEAKKLDAILGRIRPTCSPDIDNIFKSLADGLNGVVYRDDSLIVSIMAQKVYGQEPLVVATVKPITGSTSEA